VLMTRVRTTATTIACASGGTGAPDGVDTRFGLLA
jgi:hypothetical protein